MSNKSEHSKFWMDGDFSVKDSRNELDLIKLAAYRRAVANFVYILTGKNIPVRFSEKNTSLTDGTVIYIGGELSKGEVDATVGLSLHEAMHIVKSDFTILKNLWQNIPSRLFDITEGKFTRQFVSDFVKYMLNVVEDRYIDAFAYENAPGYRGYYKALYEKYFYVAKIDNALKSKALRRPTVFAYKFRLTNLVNPNSDLDALPDLRKIAEAFGLDNILRLSSPRDRLDLAIELTEMIFTHVIEEKNKGKKKPKSGGSGDDGSGEDKQDDDKPDEDEQNEEENNSGDDTENDEEQNEEQSEEDKEQEREDLETQNNLKGVVDKQEQFINRTIKQKSLDDDTLKKLEELEKSGTESVVVGGTGAIPRVECIVVNKLTEELMSSGKFPYSPFHVLQSLISTDKTNVVRSGIVFGTALGHKLQVRGEARTTKYTRQPQGRFDKRMVYGLGYNQEDVFYRMTTDIYKNAHAHISVDASTSMGLIWNKTMKMLVAIAKAASMVQNLSISISFRSAVDIAGKETPYIVMAYDSRVDQFSKINKMFSRLLPTGTTPEGLAFEAIRDLIPPTTPMLDSYFINISDGEPFFACGAYSGGPAAEHTKRQIEYLRSFGVKVSGYFLESSTSREVNFKNRKIFTTMYGRDANFINVENVTEIANTLNKKFLQKSV